MSHEGRIVEDEQIYRLLNMKGLMEVRVKHGRILVFCLCLCVVIMNVNCHGIWLCLANTSEYQQEMDNNKAAIESYSRPSSRNWPFGSIPPPPCYMYGTLLHVQIR